jgi:hypothetical protein
VVTEYSVRSENTGVQIIREIMVTTTMSSLFVAFFTLLASTFRTHAAQAEILALRHQLAVFQKNAPRRLRLDRCDRLLDYTTDITDAPLSLSNQLHRCLPSWSGNAASP